MRFYPSNAISIINYHHEYLSTPHFVSQSYSFVDEAERKAEIA